jgi:chromate transporter
MLILSSLYARYHAVAGIPSLFSGLHVVVVAIVANATYSFGRITFKNYREVFIAMAASIFFWIGTSPFIVIIEAALAGIIFLRGRKIVSESAKNRYNFKQLLMLLVLPLLILAMLYFINSKLFKLATLMMRIDVFAFGGGFAALPLMLHEIVHVRGWLDNKTFMDGIALGQVTPGPIVITATFVGYMLYGLWGAIVATIAIFTPSFLMVVAFTPVFDRFRSSVYFLGATKGILASFVGLLFFVVVNFGLAVPWDLVRVVMAGAAFGALVRKVDILYVVIMAAVVSTFVF